MKFRTTGGKFARGALLWNVVEPDWHGAIVLQIADSGQALQHRRVADAHV
jgi:hypothetical protein